MSEDASTQNEASNASPEPENGAGAQSDTSGATGKTAEGADATSKDDASKTDATGKDDKAKTEGADKDGNAKTDGADKSDGQDKAKADGQDKEDPSASKGPSKEQTDAFTLYEKALGATDWAYKAKTGSERDLGHQSVGIAERAYISAALYDKKAADKLWEDATHKPPKPELQARIEEARKVDPQKGVADLTAGFATLQDRQKLWNLTLNREKLDQQMSRWEGNIGDARDRATKHQRDANDQLLQPERQGQGDDSGLEMFLRSLKNGWKAGRDLKAAGDNRSFSREHEEMIRGSKKAHGILHKQIENFQPGDGMKMEETTGEMGKTSRRFGGVGNLVRSVLDKKKPGADAGTDKTVDPSNTVETPGKGFGSRMASMMGKRSAAAGADAGISR